MITAYTEFKKRLELPIVSLILVLLAACSLSQGNEIVGKWTTADGTYTMEFFKDGTLQEVHKFKEIDPFDTNYSKPLKMIWRTETMGGTYKFIENSRIKLTWGGMDIFNGPIVDTVLISGNDLTLTAPDGTKAVYKRVIN